MASARYIRQSTAKWSIWRTQFRVEADVHHFAGFAALAGHVASFLPLREPRDTCVSSVWIRAAVGNPPSDATLGA